MTLSSFEYAALYRACVALKGHPLGHALSSFQRSLIFSESGVRCFRIRLVAPQVSFSRLKETVTLHQATLVVKRVRV
jgi:hypothetical protein